ncbi:hypothetical protein [Agrobacterium sp. MCAB5]|uniref:hypothetical protein n=1 Tax=Agrobacterium sp. MCAB5 TaxID=3233042 RepID=UPI003F92CE68
MPQVNQFFQPPLYWQQFEELTESVVAEVFRSVPTRVGRPGQAQNGVDVYAKTKSHGHLGIQCKRLTDLDPNNFPLPGGPITSKILEDEVRAASGFHPNLKTFILATTAKRDAKAQLAARLLNDAGGRASSPKHIIVWFWDDFVSYLNLFPKLQEWYYETVIHIRGVDDQDRLFLELIAAAFHRPAFENPMQDEQAGDFLQALKDTQQALRTGELVDRQSRNVIRKAIGGMREISNEDWSRALVSLDTETRMLRSALSAALRSKAAFHYQGFLYIRESQLQQRLEVGRQSCIEQLNELLADAGVTPL